MVLACRMDICLWCCVTWCFSDSEVSCTAPLQEFSCCSTQKRHVHATKARDTSRYFSTTCRFSFVCCCSGHVSTLSVGVDPAIIRIWFCLALMQPLPYLPLSFIPRFSFLSAQFSSICSTVSHARALRAFTALFVSISGDLLCCCCSFLFHNFFPLSCTIRFKHTHLYASTWQHFSPQVTCRSSCLFFLLPHPTIPLQLPPQHI